MHARGAVSSCIVIVANVNHFLYRRQTEEADGGVPVVPVTRPTQLINHEQGCPAGVARVSVRSGAVCLSLV